MKEKYSLELYVAKKPPLAREASVENTTRIVLPEDRYGEGISPPHRRSLEEGELGLILLNT